jgi:signal peptidase I
MNEMKPNKILLLAGFILCSGCGKKRLTEHTSVMEPAVPAGSRLTADLRIYDSDKPKRFDIVAFHPPAAASLPQGPAQSKNVYCLRIIGLPNEKIEIEENALRIDSEEVKLPDGLNYSSDGRLLSYKLGKDEYYLLGDNTKKSFDSRYWGPVKRSNILGKIIKIQPGEVEKIKK